MAVEKNGTNVREQPAGVYRHPDTGEEIVAHATSKFGNPQAAAFMRLGFVYVGPLSAKSELKLSKDPSRKALASTEPSNKSVQELEAELARAKEREAAAVRAASDNSDLVDTKEAGKVESQNKQSAKDAKEDAKKGDVK